MPHPKSPLCAFLPLPLTLTLALALGALPAPALPAGAAAATPLVTLQPAGSGLAHNPYLIAPEADPALPSPAMAVLLRRKIKYVFVVFNENHSFDNEFGTFPGVDGLYADSAGPRAAAATPGFVQTYTDALGHTVTVQPFRVAPAHNPNVSDSVDHSHVGLAQKLDVVDGVPRMDGFARREYSRYTPPGATAAQQAKGTQYARLVMSHIDCDTVPFFWRWASNFTIFDRIFATEDGPSTPNAVAMIAGQAGETQWVQQTAHGDPAADTGTEGTLQGSFVQGRRLQRYTGQPGRTQGPPLVKDPQPYYGSPFDHSPGLAADGTVTHPRQPYGPNDWYGAGNIAANLTFASVPLTLLGGQAERVLAGNRNPGFDLPGIRRDIAALAAQGHAPVDWRWYQAGYGLESSDHDGVASHAAYVSHHDGPQYFGYLANTPALAGKLQGETAFFTDLARGRLPQGGVFYIRGGYGNQMGLQPYTAPGTPAAEVAAIRAAKAGDDDHPGYADREISEAMNARVINAIAANPALWAQSAIILTYDESDGFYDHVPPRILAYGPDGLPLARGIRVPLILISPYARTHAVSHAEGDHNAVIETLEAIFDLPPLASLPEEQQALREGNSAAFNRLGPPGFEQKYLGPRDLESPLTASLLSGFDPLRLEGRKPPLPAAYAITDPAVLTALPPYGGQGCRALHIEPQAPASDRIEPAGFNPLPSTYPAANEAPAPR